MDIIKYCVAPTPKCPFSFLWSQAIQHLPRNWGWGPELGPRDISKLPRQRLRGTALGNHAALDPNRNWWPNISFPALTATVLWASRAGFLPLSTNRASPCTDTEHPKAGCSLSGPSMWSLAFATRGINLCFEGWSFKGGSCSPILSWLQNSEPQQWALPATPTVKIMKLWLTALPSQGPSQNLGPDCVFGILNPLLLSSLNCMTIEPPIWWPLRGNIWKFILMKT